MQGDLQYSQELIIDLGLSKESVSARKVQELVGRRGTLHARDLGMPGHIPRGSDPTYSRSASGFTASWSTSVVAAVSWSLMAAVLPASCAAKPDCASVQARTLLSGFPSLATV